MHPSRTPSQTGWDKGAFAAAQHGRICRRGLWLSKCRRTLFHQGGSQQVETHLRRHGQQEMVGSQWPRGRAGPGTRGQESDMTLQWSRRGPALVCFPGKRPWAKAGCAVGRRTGEGRQTSVHLSCADNRRCRGLVCSDPPPSLFHGRDDPTFTLNNINA